jgi:GMP synthase-like glutamine amidotransferase
LTRALVLAGEDDAAGFLAERADDHGIDLVLVHRDPAGHPPSLDGFDLVMSMGSVWSVNAAGCTPWISREIDLLREASAGDLPVLGVCFGAQVLAAALGAAVRSAVRPEFGWVRAGSADEDLVPDGPWFAWHTDVLDLPAGAQQLARNPSGVQAFRAGRALGVQFHPEVTITIIDRWIAHLGHLPAAAGVDTSDLSRASLGRMESARRNAHRLFDGFMGLARAGGLPPWADRANSIAQRRRSFDTW